MPQVTAQHFGANLHLTNDSTHEGSAFEEMLKEISFYNFRYPGGAIAEKQTWDNHGLDRLFGEPINPDSPDYAITLGEALQFSIDHGASLSIVIPTVQFYDPLGDNFDTVNFNRYLDHLEVTLKAWPDAKLSGLEIGNEYWAELSATQYGKIANYEIPGLQDVIDSLAHEFGPDWEAPDIGIQAGAAWRSTGASESHQIAAEISMDNRALIGTIYQHHYPNPQYDFNWQSDWAITAAEAFQYIHGFSADLRISYSEFNIGRIPGDAEVWGVNQGTLWIEEFARQVDAGVDAIDHWGINYRNLTNKLYDRQFPAQEGKDGGFVTIATPTGQVYDLAHTHLIGKNVISDTDALQGIKLSGKLSVTGFEEAGQKAVFLGNLGKSTVSIDLSELPDGQIVTTHHLIPADSPYTSADETKSQLLDASEIIDARGDMQVGTWTPADGLLTLAPNSLLMLLLSDDNFDLNLEGAHNQTDPSNGMTNDIIVGGEGNDVLSGHVGNDTLIGNGGNDILIDGPGNNFLSAGEGHDVIVIQGGSQSDTSSVDGGPGSNLIVSDGSANVRLERFQLYDETGAGDTLAFGGAFADVEAFRNAMDIVGEDLVLQMPSGTTYTIVGGAEYAEVLPAQVLDFMSQDGASEVINGYFSRLTEDQFEAIHQWVRDCAEVKAQGAIWDAGEDAFVEQTGLSSPEHPTPQEPPDDNQDGDGEGSGPTTESPRGPISEAPAPTVPDSDQDYPTEPDHPSPDDGPQNENGSGGGCFVATAAYGDRLHPDVVALRAFRDYHLIRYRGGRAFVRFYWVVGPKLAQITTPDSLHGRLARLVLSRLVMALRRCRLTVPKDRN